MIERIPKLYFCLFLRDWYRHKNVVTLYSRKCNPNFAFQDECKLNPDELLPLIVSDD
jgi:hypothetical protein